MMVKESKWQTKDQLLDSLCELVEIPSVTHSIDEIAVAEYVEKKLRELPYFQTNKEYLTLHTTEDDRKFVTALVKKGTNEKRTVILVSHFDVVGVEDYGDWQEYAFQPKKLTELFYENKNHMPKEVQKDLEDGNWLFGRGTMDMKCGLALHMSLIEEACSGSFDGNLLLLTVCDEEVNSVGMRNAAPVLLEMAKQHHLEYNACLNSEPMFARYPGDENQYIYSGSIGKILPGFLCYGKETHVGEPFSGLNANFMASLLTNELELNTEFCEVVEGEVTPPPTNLIQKDLKKEYNVQIPHRAITMFNLFIMERSMNEVVEHLRKSAEKVARRIKQGYEKRAAHFSTLENSTPKEMSVKVYQFDELLHYAIDTYGKEKVEAIQTKVLRSRGAKDDRDLTIHLVDELSILCKELSPMIVLFFAPPYYPAVSSRNHPRISRVVDHIIGYAKNTDDIELKNQNYFAGLSDLSYVSLEKPASSLKDLTSNMPLWGKGYHVPLDVLENLNIPVLNLGPVGKDAHKWTERLDVDHAFGALRDMLSITVNLLLDGDKD
ncbi:M20/M25/M40 family metallo-hydrolase [Neobacillus sp. MER 74]|uniref:M20/M25/M40 family metallo-hydrolase n=1 Tax=Neobacillus sp. MER 74 TaxID=2939566 RepID=UPI00203CC97B|nr:M20/M25/M40 family metallo-hydrolase [Neobacillus sp. MER 74]MCM3117569.1 M20/M25/M40 family metallo-hydrolase [Neobacillus sp. MER 74]